MRGLRPSLPLPHRRERRATERAAREREVEHPEGDSDDDDDDGDAVLDEILPRGRRPSVRPSIVGTVSSLVEVANDKGRNSKACRTERK